MFHEISAQAYVFWLVLCAKMCDMNHIPLSYVQQAVLLLPAVTAADSGTLCVCAGLSDLPKCPTSLKHIIKCLWSLNSFLGLWKMPKVSRGDSRSKCSRPWLPAGSATGCSFERGLVGWWLVGWWAGWLWSSAIHFENGLICLVQSA